MDFNGSKKRYSLNIAQNKAHRANKKKGEIAAKKTNENAMRQKYN